MHLVKKSFFVIAVASLIVLGAFILYTNVVVLSYGKDIVANGRISTTTVALVFGGGMKTGGLVSDMAADRVDRAIELYKIGLVEELLISGDDGVFHENEVDAMSSYAMLHGVPANHILVDRHGYRTYESCVRAHNIYGIKEVIAVSQSFHLPRIIFLCNHLGVRTIGVPAEFHIRRWNRIKNSVRESLARVKAWIDIEVTPPQPPVKI